MCTFGSYFIVGIVAIASYEFTKWLWEKLGL